MYCKRCGTRLNQGMLVCPECGARQRRQASAFACAYCRGRITVGMAMCPHCGRNARPAGPRWGLWLVGLLIAMVVGLWGLGRLPVQALRQTVAEARANLTGLVQITELLAPLPTPTAAAVGAGAFTPPGTAVTLALAVTPTAPPATATPSPTASPAPAATSTPTATATQPATATNTPTAKAPGSAAVHRVRAGDTLESIGVQFGVSWQAIAAANKITAETTLQIGQELIIPPAGATVAASATPRPRPTNTPAPPTATPLPALPAPELESPGDQTPFSGANAFIELQWRSVGPLPAGVEYLATVSYLNNGVRQEHSWNTPQTSIRMPPWLHALADQPARRYTWFVTVVQVTTDGKGGKLFVPLSPPSASRTLAWN